MTAFFIPGGPAGVKLEKLYADIRDGARESTGHSAQPSRIFKLSFRQDGHDLEAEVGKPDPVRGKTVLAILDLGRGLPYLVHCRASGARPQQILVSKPVYSVTEFGP